MEFLTVDFHIHSTASDGTFAPSAIYERARGFSAIALTDHDNCDGVEELLDSQRSDSARAIAGIELSIDPGRGFDRFHLLGLGIDHRNVKLRRFLRKVLAERDNRNVRICNNFLNLGIDMVNCPRPVSSYANGDVLARPHFARWLMDNGYVASVKAAFDIYLAPDSPPATRCYEERWHPSQSDVFDLIHRAGGVCVMAHPKYWRDEWKTSGVDFASAERGLRDLREIGLDGVEALYQANTNEENVQFTRIATRLGFLKSAGSDFHGENKSASSLGMQVEESFIAPLLERFGLR